jgi:hypothetical protein
MLLKKGLFVATVPVFLCRALPGVEGIIQGQIDQQLDGLRQDLKAQVQGSSWIGCMMTWRLRFKVAAG